MKSNNRFLKIKSNLKFIVGTIVLLILIFFILSIYYNAVKYSVNTLDDFIHYNAFKYIYSDRSFNLFDFAIKYALWDMVNLGGRYSAMFIQILLGPTPYTDIIVKNRIVMTSNMLFYFINLYLFIFAIISKMVIKKMNLTIKIFMSTLIFFVLIFLHNFYQFYTEIFTWFSGATSYSIPLSMLLLSLSLFIFYIESENKYKVILIPCILFTSIVATGGSVSVLCIAFVLMLSLLMYVIVNKRFDIINFGLFFHYFCFAMLNVRAPGNYYRLADIIEKK